MLWEDDAKYEVGREYELTFALDGPALGGYLDGGVRCSSSMISK